MDKKQLRSEMILHDDTNESLAAALGISPQRLSAKINETNGAEFTQGEIDMIRIRYGMTPEKVIATFFNQKVS